MAVDAAWRVAIGNLSQAVSEASRIGHKLADEETQLRVGQRRRARGGRIDRAVSGLPRCAGCGADTDGPVDARRFAEIEQFWIEETLRADDVVIRLVMREPHPEVECQARLDFPGVLRVPGYVLIEIT